MILPANNKIMVKVDLAQKQAFHINGVSFMAAQSFEKNYRNRSPVVAIVVEGNIFVNECDVLLCHHNYFQMPSPYHVQDDLFAIPAGKNLFAVIRKDGTLKPIYGNIICDTVDIETPFPLPPEQRKKHLNRARVIDGGSTRYEKDDLIFHRPSAWYEIVYVEEGIEKRVIKVAEDQVCGVIKQHFV